MSAFDEIVFNSSLKNQNSFSITSIGTLLSFIHGRARCRSVVKSVRSWCDVSLDRSFMVDPLSYFSFQPVVHDWCNKGRVRLSYLWDGAYNKSLAANLERVAHVIAAAGFLSRYLNDTLPYVRRNITVNKMC